MSILCRLRAIAGAIPRAGIRRQARQFFAATRDCRRSQHDALRRLVALNRDSDFGRKHRLDQVNNVADLRRQIPIADYDYYSPYIEQLKLGNHSALLGPNNKLLMFSLSSGTTSNSKFIPITEQFLADYRRGWQVWGINAFDDHSGINSRRIVQLSSNYDSYRTPGGTPCGNISGLATAMQKPIVRTMYTVPGIVSNITRPEAKNYMAMRLAVADKDVGLVITANPSTLIQLAKLADDKKEQLIRDIADGTVSNEFPIDFDVRHQLGRKITRRNRRRARKLERIVEKTGHLWPIDYWPGLKLVAVWTGGRVGWRTW